MNAPPAQYGKLRDGWRTDLDALTGDFIMVTHHRQIWREMRAALVNSQDTIFLDHYARMYATAQAVAVRRICEFTAKSGTISLGSLLKALEVNQGALNRAWFEAMYVAGASDEVFAGHLSVVAVDEYERRFGDGQGGFSLEKNARRKRLLEEKVETVTGLVDRVVAHRDRKAGPDVSYVVLDDAIGAISTVLQDLNLLLFAQGRDSFEPTIQSNWREPFERPLFE